MNSGQRREKERILREEEHEFMEKLKKVTGCRVVSKGTVYNSIVIYCDRNVNNNLSQWRKEIYGKVNAILLHHPMGQKLKMQKKVGTILSKGICQFCKIDMDKVHCSCGSYRNEYSDDECYSNCYECPERRMKDILTKRRIKSYLIQSKLPTNRFGNSIQSIQENLRSPKHFL